jgi:hypothetical protein
MQIWGWLIETNVEIVIIIKELIKKNVQINQQHEGVT